MENTNKVVKNIDWEEFGILIDKLCVQLLNKGFLSVYGIYSNGTIIAGIIAKKLNLRYILHNKDIDFETLIVDDISDTGNTLSKFRLSYIANKTATLHIRYSTKFTPDYFVETINEEWIHYPFER